MLPTRLEQIKEVLFEIKKIKLFIKREDLNHPTIQGNKFRKLKYNLQEAKETGKNTLLTFGGAFSNHVYATAAAGKAFDFQTIAVIRGEKIEPLNATLAFAEEQNMRLHFVSRSEYRQKENIDFLQDLRQQFGDFYLLPEGGSNALAVKGCAEIVMEIQTDFDYLCSPVGTGATLAGLIHGSKKGQKVIGFPALKGGDFLKKDIDFLLENFENKNKEWALITDYHFGGYAKFQPELIAFMDTFQQKHGIQLEPIYTGKMLFGIYDLIQKDYFKPNSTIIAVHTGGLQGLQGFAQRFGMFGTNV